MKLDLENMSYLDSETEDTKLLNLGLRVTWIGLLANFLLIILKFWGGIAGKSQALVADAVHSISDFFSDIVVIVGLKVGRKSADDDHPYGHGRIETIASLAVGLILLIVAASILYDATQAIYEHRGSTPTVLALIIAAVSIITKEALYWYTIKVGHQLRSSVLIGNAWHHRSDALSSIAVLVGLVAARYNPDWYLADAFAAGLVSLFIGRVSYKLVRSALYELADTAPDSEIMEQIASISGQIPGVLQAHDIKGRQSGPLLLIDLHIVVKSTISVHEGHEIAEAVKSAVIDKIEIVGEVLIHVEPESELL